MRSSKVCHAARSLSLAFLVGCAWGASGPPSPRTIKLATRAGALRIELRDDRVLFLRETKVVGDSLFGLGIGKQRDEAFAVAINQITRLDELASDKPASLGAAVVTLVGIAAVVALTVLILFWSSWEGP